MGRVELDVPFAKVQVRRCPRCSDAHTTEVAQLHRPVYNSRAYMEWTHFFVCPQYDQPVLLKIDASLEYLPDPPEEEEDTA